jgi:hypothetical protein
MTLHTAMAGGRSEVIPVLPLYCMSTKSKMFVLYCLYGDTVHAHFSFIVQPLTLFHTIMFSTYYNIAI